jgi:hypothetical protein
VSQITNAAKGLTAAERTLVYLAGATVGGTGGLLGFLVGYTDNRNYDAPQFQRGLRDAKNWRALAESISNCYNAKLNLEIAGATNLDLPVCRRLLAWERQNSPGRDAHDWNAPNSLGAGITVGEN